METDEMELDTIGDRKTALFVIISDTDDTFNFVVSILYTQLFNLLCDKADDEYGGRLPVHVRCLLDEFANIGQIPKFEKLIATIRSREISASIILQSQSQLKAIYKDNADTTNGNYYQFSAAAVACDLGGNWQLPTSNSTTDNGSFGKLTTAYGATNGATMTAAPLSFPYAGRIAGYNGSLGRVGEAGVYWSSTPYGWSSGYILYFLSNSVDPSDYNNSRCDGRSVRCLVLGS